MHTSSPAQRLRTALADLWILVLHPPRIAVYLLLASACLTLLVSREISLLQQTDARLHTAHLADQLVTKLEERLQAYALILRGGAGLFDASGEVSREDWRRFNDKLAASELLQDVQGIGFAQRVDAGQVQQHQIRVRGEGFSDYRIWPEGRREMYGPILYLEPFDAINQSAFGYDMFSEAVRRAAMQRARDTGRAALSGRVELVQKSDNASRTGFLIYVPVYAGGGMPDSLDERRASLRGWVYSPYLMSDLMDGLLRDWQPTADRPLGITVHEGEVLEPQTLLFSNLPQPFAAPSTLGQGRTVDFRGQRWQLLFDYPDPAEVLVYSDAWVFFAGGMLFNLLLFVLISSLARTRANAEALAQRLTFTVNQQKAELGEMLVRLQTIADRVPGMVYEYRRYADGRQCFPYSSEGIRKVYRTSPEAVMADASVVFEVIHPDDLALVTASIEESERTLEPWRQEYRVRFADGEVRWLYGDSLPHATEDNSISWYGVISDITHIKEHEAQLQHIASYDPLTQLPNRLLLADRLQQAMIQAQRRGRHLAVVYLDLDGFKRINDQHGHDMGDQLLVAIAGRLRGELRDEDTLARLGGDEFVAVLLDFADVSTSAALLERLLAAAARPLLVEGQQLQVSASIGITFYPQAESVEADQLLRQADQAMYQAKLAGKGRYYVFDAALDRQLREHNEVIEQISRALAAGEFTLHYQPKVNLRTGEVLGVEALLRWQHPRRGLLAPMEFLPYIEDHPLIVELGHWVLDAALRQMREWREAGLQLPVSINVSGRELREPGFLQHLRSSLERFSDIPPGDLELEVLETSTLGDLGEASRQLRQCRELGLGVALDDFGTGYSSLTYLKQLPAQLIKIDQSFVRDLLENPEDVAILRGILAIAKAFGRHVIAEGVESVEHGRVLLELGCELAQGYGIAHPMPAEALPSWLRSFSCAPAPSSGP